MTQQRAPRMGDMQVKIIAGAAADVEREANEYLAAGIPAGFALAQNIIHADAASGKCSIIFCLAREQIQTPGGIIRPAGPMPTPRPH